MTREQARDCLPTQLQQWGKVRLLDGSGTVHAILGLRTPSTRDMSFMHYRAYGAAQEERYGQLQHILGIPIRSEQPVILAIIRRCQPLPSYSLDRIAYDTLGALQVVGLDRLDCVVGRVQDSRGRWTIIERAESIRIGDVQEE
ncbi:hypothetical protein CALCODRAFT_509382 [Calocera cornea HHB12733]|uniref:Uncharacterized protein n=1 Tax=Calocera cornea HHB12733 TaxID=1353952 RepID=A0A165FED8_9BASI|nr:hypothetical protein CALCODRAFT_509382 [Calocera cornea HHB12733]